MCALIAECEWQGAAPGVELFASRTLLCQEAVTSANGRGPFREITSAGPVCHCVPLHPVRKVRPVMSSQAIVNPEELRRFALGLKKFNSGLADQLASLSGQLESLSATWRDQENQRFTEEFRRNLQGMARFIEANNQYIPFLLRKAERIDEYLQQR